MAIQRIPLLFLIFSLCSCKEKMIAYEYVVFRDNSIKMWPDTIPANAKDDLENSDFSINDDQGKILASGKFISGLRVGQWIYHPSDTQSIKIDWKPYTNDTVSINYPSDWTIYKSPQRPFQATFQSNSKIAKDKFFIIFPHNKDSIDMDLASYFCQSWCSPVFRVTSRPVPLFGVSVGYERGEHQQTHSL